MKVASAIAALLLAFTASADVLSGAVVGVSDGDTITVLDANNVQHKIRLSGIDAPEKKQPFGQVAKTKLAGLVYGKKVSVEWYKLDRYGRTIGVVTADGKDAGLEMLRAGMAWHYKKYQSEQTPSDRVIYNGAEGVARSSRLGVWSDASPVAPWEWRTWREIKKRDFNVVQ